MLKAEWRHPSYKVWENLVGKVDLGSFKYKIKLYVNETGIVVSMPVEDIGLNGEININSFIPFEHISLYKRPEEILFELIINMVKHELQEQFSFAGRRIFDPHREEIANGNYNSRY